MTFHVLVTSISRKVSMLQTIQNALNRLNLPTKLFGADSNPDCIGKHFVDTFWQMPRLENLEFEDLIQFCKQNQIRVIIPSRDGELAFFADRLAAFRDYDIEVMVSSPNAIRHCLDKLEFYQQVTDLGYPAIFTSESIDDIDSVHYVVKERIGAGSIHTHLNLTYEQAKEIRLKSPIYQPFIEGQEVSADLFVTREKEVHGVVLRTRDLVVEGESQVTTSFRDPSIEEICSRLALSLDLYGHVMFQGIQNNEFQFLECNPRFGGASALSVAAGLYSFEWFFSEVLGRKLPPFHRSEKEKTLIRFPEDRIQ